MKTDLLKIELTVTEDELNGLIYAVDDRIRQLDELLNHRSGPMRLGLHAHERAKLKTLRARLTELWIGHTMPQKNKPSSF